MYKWRWHEKHLSLGHRIISPFLLAGIRPYLATTLRAEGHCPDGDILV